MTTRIGLLAAVGFATLAAASPAHAAVTVNGACLTDLTLGAGSTLVSCVGRYDNNVLNNASNATINAALIALNYAGPAITYGNISAANILSTSGNVNASVNFPGVLNGIAYVGVHYGNGQGGPGNSTTFYKISASNLDAFTLNLNASSTATLFAVVPAGVPEPATWAMMLVGFGAVGGALRRRQKVAARIHFA